MIENPTRQPSPPPENLLLFPLVKLVLPRIAFQMSLPLPAKGRPLWIVGLGASILKGKNNSTHP